jgi:hypothetical protein
MRDGWSLANMLHHGPNVAKGKHFCQQAVFFIQRWINGDVGSSVLNTKRGHTLPKYEPALHQGHQASTMMTYNGRI